MEKVSQAVLDYYKYNLFIPIQLIVERIDQDRMVL